MIDPTLKKIGFLSLAAGFVLNFDNSTFLAFVLGAIVTACYLYAIAWAALGLVRKYKGTLETNHSYLGLSLFVLTLILLVAVGFGTIVNFPAVTPDHFRTNILTGSCDYGGYSPNVATDPWYYRPDCRTEQKLEEIAGTPYERSRIEECNEACGRNNTWIYCDDTARGTNDGPADISCNLVTSCESIACS